MGALRLFFKCRAVRLPDVSTNNRNLLDQAGLKDVAVRQDCDKGVVTLGGHVAADTGKSQAESIAKSIAVGQIIVNQIAVMRVRGKSAARTMNAALDSVIEKNLYAALTRNGIHRIVKYEIKNGVVKLTGQVNSQDARKHVEQIASAVPNVQLVVNQLQTRNQKASSSNL